MQISVEFEIVCEARGDMEGKPGEMSYGAAFRPRHERLRK